jgi:hypothetical protein
MSMSGANFRFQAALCVVSIVQTGAPDEPLLVKI